MTTQYSEKLKDPRWQKLRLKVMERESFKCQCCESDKETLHVHHLIYSKGEPWEAPMETLECLCQACHQTREEFNEYFGRGLISTKFCREFIGFWSDAFEDRTGKFNRNPPAVLSLYRELYEHHYQEKCIFNGEMNDSDVCKNNA